jgi:hypothetical protein
MRTNILGRIVILGLGLALASACVAEEDYPAGSPSGPGGSSGGQSGGGTCDFDDVRTMILGRCTGSGCHDADAPAGGLDLASGGVVERLLGAASAGCSGRTLVVAGDPGESYLYEKLSGDTPQCGAPMPKGGTPLTATELGCVGEWIASLTGDGGGGGGGNAGDGSGGGGGSGW